MIDCTGLMLVSLRDVFSAVKMNQGAIYSSPALSHPSYGAKWLLPLAKFLSQIGICWYIGVRA